jgi:hypothetical protein
VGEEGSKALKVRFSQRACFTALLLAFAGVMFCLTFGLGRVARMVPFAIVVPTLLLLVFQLLLDLLPRLAQSYGRLENRDLFGVQGLREKLAEGGEAAEGEAAEGGQVGRKEGRAFLWLFLMLGLIYLLGLFMALPLYTLLYLKSGAERWLTAIVMALTIACLIYGVSLLDPGARLYAGLLWNWLGMGE